MRLAWYILRMHIGPFLFGTSVVVFVFLLQLIFKHLNNLVGKGLSLWVILQFIAFNIAWMLVLAVPMGMLVATLMAYGKLSGQNELTIIKSSGGSALRAMFPAIAAGLAMFIALFVFNDKILPETNHRAFVLQNDIAQLKPTFAIDPGRFSQLQNFNILARQVDRERNILYNVTIYEPNGDYLNIINAKRAELRPNVDFSRMVMTFHDGEIHTINRRLRTEFRKLAFEQHQVTLVTNGFNFSRSDPKQVGRNDRTMNIAAMRKIVDSATASSDRSRKQFEKLLAEHFRLKRGAQDATATPGITPRQEAAGLAITNLAMVRPQLESESLIRYDGIRSTDQYDVEIYKKYSIPAACLVFVFVGAPLGIVVRRGNFGVSASIALGFFIVYWACLVAGEKLADRAILSPAVAMWMADVVIGLLGIYLTVLVSRETVTFSFEFNAIKRLLRMNRKAPSQAA
ncbi:MAG: LptF/LptG family permease [Bacteroidetes bacterium]|nr:LptF/LptG family permease [Bacteroidota bacterium]